MACGPVACRVSRVNASFPTTNTRRVTIPPTLIGGIMFLRISLGVFIGVVAITLIGCALALWIPWCTVGQNGCKMGASEWAYWVGAIGTITAVGVAIALASYQNSMHEQREARAEADALHGLLLGIRAELQVS